MSPETRVPDSFLLRLLRRLGGHYILVAIVVTQLVTYLVVGPISALIQNNAEMTREQLVSSMIASIVLATFANIVIAVLAYFISRNAFRRLQNWARNIPSTDTPEQEESAWREVVDLPRKIGLYGTIASFLLVIGPLMLYQHAALGLTLEQVGYTLLGGFVAALAIVTISVLGAERFLRTAREVLLPKDFNAQIGNVISLRFVQKLQLLTLALIASGVIIVAPIGYHQISVITRGGESQIAQAVLRQYQFQSLLATGLVVLLGAGLTAMLARALSDPLRQLTEIFRRVEQGDLSQRASVIATDEAGELEVYFNRMITRLETLQSSLEQEVTERTAQLEAVNEVGRAASAILNPNELIEKVVHLITNRFGYYYVALFLVDATGRWAELRNATGDAGRVLRETHHRLEVGGKSMVGYAISMRQARIALDVGVESVRFDNPLLPYTRSEIALPLVIGERVIGALDVQSTEQSAFGPEDVETLQNMANHVADTLENARLFEETQQRLQELQNIQYHYVRQAWSARMEHETLEYGIGDDIPASGETNLEVPLALRNQVIGNISLTSETEWPPEERAWMESVATQAAIALENARLMEESQKAAQYQRLIAEITGKIWAAPSRDEILQTAIKEIGRALNVSEAVIELGAEAEKGTLHHG